MRQTRELRRREGDPLHRVRIPAGNISRIFKDGPRTVGSDAIWPLATLQTCGRLVIAVVAPRW